MLDKDRIFVIDGYPGQGKTSYAHQMINESSSEERFIFVTPYLEKVKEIVEVKCPTKGFVEPDIRHGRGTKREHFLKLIRSGVNIATTHALFQSIDDDMIEALRLSNYTLILDEVFEVIESFDLYRDERDISYLNADDLTNQEKARGDIRSLIKKEYIKVKDDFTVSWIEDDILTKYENLKTLCDRGLLYLINDYLLIWSFPVEIFREGIFDRVYILTYQFEFQIQAYYYKLFDIEYSKWHVEREDGQYKLVPTDKTNSYESKWKERIRHLIHIVDNRKLNRIGDVYYDVYNRPIKTSLSRNWYASNVEHIGRVRDNVVNFFTNITKTKASDKYWTTFLEFKKHFKHKSLSKKHFVSLNARATNEYRDRHYLAYCINRYLVPYYVQFFEKRNINVDQDKIALSELVQWIWRSAIREGEEIWVYIPSQRMRTLLQKFLNNEEIVF